MTDTEGQSKFGQAFEALKKKLAGSNNGKSLRRTAAELGQQFGVSKKGLRKEYGKSKLQ